MAPSFRPAALAFLCLTLLAFAQPPPKTDVITCELSECNYMCVCQKLAWTIDWNHPILGGATGAVYFFGPLPSSSWPLQAYNGRRSTRFCILPHSPTFCACTLSFSTTILPFVSATLPLPPDEICKKWKKDGKLPDDKCETRCIAMSQHLDASAGADPYVCFKAVEEAKQLEKDEKNMDSFKRISVSLKRVRRRGHSTAKQHQKLKLAAKDRTLMPPRALSLRSVLPNIPPPRNLIPDTWEEGPKFDH